MKNLKIKTDDQLFIFSVGKDHMSGIPSITFHKQTIIFDIKEQFNKIKV